MQANPLLSGTNGQVFTDGKRELADHTAVPSFELHTKDMKPYCDHVCLPQHGRERIRISIWSPSLIRIVQGGAVFFCARVLSDVRTIYRFSPLLRA